MTKRKQARKPTDAERLAALVQESTIAAYVRINGAGNHESPDLQAIKHLGRIGWLVVAEELIRNEVLPPRET